mmetsp:Transcript_29463/g.32609  ORF Transcript_29463/g.32609 Transcript_29463/m.32609 type:complete len:290 (+) Transcript_29463:19-888(+)
MMMTTMTIMRSQSSSSLMAFFYFIVVSLFMIQRTNGLSSSSSISSSSAPRFDVFSKRIVGRHYIPGGGTESVNILGEDSIQDNGIQQSGSGFVYFECGSYCSGPLDLSLVDDDDNCYFTASLEVPSLSPGSRVYVEGDVISSQGEMDGNIAMQYPRIEDEKKIEEEEELYNDSFMLEIIDSVPNFLVINEIRATAADDENTTNNGESSWDRNSLTWNKKQQQDNFSSEGPYQLWMVNEPENQWNGYDMILGITCTQTGYVKNFVRSYHENGNLVTVVKQEGQLMSSIPI